MRKISILLFLALGVRSVFSEANVSPYGVNAHLMWLSNPKERIEECKWISATGIKRVRCGLQWQYVQTAPGVPLNFAHYDRIVAELEAAGGGTN